VNQIAQVAPPAPVYRGFAPRPTIPDIKLFHGYMAVVPEVDRPDFAALERRLDEPFVGVTTDGNVRGDLFDPAEHGAASDSLVTAALEFLDSLSGDDQRFAALQPLDSPHRRRWTNAFTTWLPPGLMLDDLTPAQREAAVGVVAKSMSAAGLDAARNVMKLNEALGDLIGLYRDTLREWVYWFTIFGQPSEQEPWGWQLMGHHLVLNCFVLGDRVIVSPVFMGAETVEPDEGRFVGIKVFADEHERGLEMIRSLSNAKQDQAILYRSMLSTELPPELAGRVDGRHRGGAGRDNLVLPFEGIRAGDLDRAQRDGLVALIETYLGRSAHGDADLARAKRHLDETFFAWIGDPDEDGPFYYRVHSPVVLIEFDHHPGIFITAEEPQPFHVHTIVRMPNAGDYGMALLAQYRDGLARA
jgi:Protein of unknown function (DUF3500)